MEKQLFPKAFIQVSIEHYSFRIGRKSRAIYLTLLIGLCGAVVVLPLVTVEVTRTAQGAVATQGANFILQAPVTASLVRYHLAEGQSVRQGDTLMRLDTHLLAREMLQTNARITELDAYLTDLAMLVSDATTDRLSTTAYLLAQQQYGSGLDRLTVKHTNASKTYQRQLQLYQASVIPASELQRDREALDLAKAEVTFYTQQALHTWKQEILKLEQEYQQLTLKTQKLEDEQRKHVLTSPSKGTLQQVASLSAGQLLQVGTKLGEVSTDTTLLAVCWVSPSDIGLLQERMTATIRIDAYPSNQWGFVQGVVSSISQDAYMIDRKPYFKVTCVLKRTHLSLQNGFVGKLKKGMTLQANFKVTKRSLYDLLYDKVDDWLNPKMI